MVRRFKPSYEWAVKLSEKAAQEKREGSWMVKELQNDEASSLRSDGFVYITRRSLWLSAKGILH